jgi:hypothetical protein
MPGSVMMCLVQLMGGWAQVAALVALAILRASAGGALSKVPHDRKAGSHPGDGVSIIALSSMSVNVLRCCARVRAFGARCYWSSSLFGCR